MRLPGLLLAALFLVGSFTLAKAASTPSCLTGARSFLPCELQFEGQSADAAYRTDVLKVEFRSPTHKTYLMHAFWDGSLRVRFSPTEAGSWTYRVLTDIAAYKDKEATFNAADSGLPGMVNVANLRHWRTTDKKPHLWLSAEIPWLSIPPGEFDQWLTARKHDGFTHIRGTLLTSDGSLKPLTPGGQPNAAYFAALDDRLLAAAASGFTLDLLLADKSFLASGFLANFDVHEPLVRYLVARYGGLNVTWQGIQSFEDTANARALLKNLGLLLQNLDGFQHPRSTDARNSTFPLISDSWLTYGVESSPNPQLGAVEHQFTNQPEVHRITSIEPDAFRHELWNCTTNGEYPTVSYESLKNEANVKAIQIWNRILSNTRHWELEPYFDVDDARAVGLTEVEYLAYAQDPGIVEITLPRHKYNPRWINPATGEELELKNYRGEVFSRQTPDSAHDWILQVPREGKKESMLKYYYFESEDPPEQEIESDTSRIPFEVADPGGDQLSIALPPLYSLKVTKSNRASRKMQIAWWGEIVAEGEGARLLGLGRSGTLAIPKQPDATLNLRVLAINANGKAFEVDRVYHLNP